jgi:hypothetical protein
MGIATAIAIGIVPEFVEFQQFKVAVIICKSVAEDLSCVVSDFDFLRACLRVSWGYINHSDFGHAFGA